MPSTNISNWRLAAFAAPAAASSAASLPLILYIPVYYTADLGFSLTAFGLIFAATKVWDVITDPTVGVLTDRFETPWGRRRVWLALGAIIMVLGSVLLFFPERFNDGPISTVYLSVVLIALYTGFTFFEVSHTAWAAELSDEYHNRTRMQGWVAWFGVAGGLLVMSAPALIEQLGRTTTYQERIESMGWFMVIALPITMVLAVTLVPEGHYKPVERIGFRTAIRALATNKPMLRIVIVNFLLAFPAASRSAMYVFFIVSVLESPGYISLILVAYFTTGPIAIPFWAWASGKVGKHKAVAYGLFFHAIIALFYLLPGSGDVWMYVAIHLLSGLVYQGHGFLTRAMVADVTDADNLETGQQRTGLYFSLVTMTSKVGNAVAVAAVYPLLQLIGYVSGGDNSPEVIDRFRYMYVAVPFAVEMVAVWIIYHYPLDEKVQHGLREKLAARDAAKA